MSRQGGEGGLTGPRLSCCDRKGNRKGKGEGRGRLKDNPGSGGMLV